MSARTVTNQAELDAALADKKVDWIDINSPRGVWLEISSNGVGSATVSASGSATVSAYDSATVSAYDSATVRAASHVAVHLHKASVSVTGGVVIDHTQIDETDPQTWCDYHGVQVTDGIATVYKAVRADWTSPYGTSYAPGTLPDCNDWRDTDDCGNGLHFGPTPVHAQYYLDDAAHFLAVGIALSDLRPITTASGAAKCKAPRAVRACVEVDVHGREIAQVSA